MTQTPKTQTLDLRPETPKTQIPELQARNLRPRNSDPLKLKKYIYIQLTRARSEEGRLFSQAILNSLYRLIKKCFMVTQCS